MKVLVTDIDQRFSLRNQSVTNYLVLQLPSGRQIRALMDDADTQAVIAESAGSSQELVPAGDHRGRSEVAYTGPEDYGDNPFQLDPNATLDTSPQLTPVGDMSPGGWDAPEPTKHVTSGAIKWEKLPDTQLPPQMKNILRASRINPVISIEDLDRLKMQILERMKEKPQAGQVVWDSGPRRKMETASRRTVPMDEAGNPIPPGGIIEADPGEGPDPDDDGVAQA